MSSSNSSSHHVSFLTVAVICLFIAVVCLYKKLYFTPLSHLNQTSHKPELANSMSAQTIPKISIKNNSSLVIALSSKNNDKKLVIGAMKSHTLPAVTGSYLVTTIPSVHFQNVQSPVFIDSNTDLKGEAQLGVISISSHGLLSITASIQRNGLSQSVLTTDGETLFIQQP